MTALLPLFLVWAWDGPVATDLVRRAMAAREAQEKQELRFTWREDVEQRPAGKKPVLTTYDVIMLEGETYRKKILVDGRPLAAKEQQKVDADFARAREERRRQRSLRTITRTVRLGGLELLERLYDLKTVGEETVAGRKTWRVEAEPKAGVVPANAEEKAALNTRRTLWFDQAEGVELMRRDHFVRATNGFQPGSELEMQFGRVGEAWLIERLLLRYDLKAMALARGRGEAQHRFYDYKRFAAESTLLPQ